MPPDMVKIIADGIENSTFVLFENSGHYSFIEEQDKFLATVKDFMGFEE
jgi:pimeloyl-ACP methyl ester carboxylesterase